MEPLVNYLLRNNASEKEIIARLSVHNEQVAPAVCYMI
jgi:hypothetical protein